MTASDRKDVLILGCREIDQRLFNIRGLTLRPVRASEIKQVDLNNACGILVAEPARQLREIPRLAERASEYFRMGLMVGIWPADQPARQQAHNFREKFPEAFQPHPKAPEGGSRWLEIQEDLELLAEAFRTHEVGPRFGNPTIKPYDAETQVPPEHVALLQRAFYDASVLIVESLADGKTADGTYRVFVQSKEEVGGPQPMPFVFKVARTTKVKGRDEWENPLYEERENYKIWAEPFIHFHLRPGLIEERCVITPFWTAISCHFVAGAVLLERTLKNRQGAGLIFSLFETTLGGLRAHTLHSELKNEAVRTFILERVKAQEFDSTDLLQARLNRAKEFGFTGTPKELQDNLAAKAVGIKSHRGIYHGDLHLGNIMVRDRDAIVIDFGSMREFGPITADPAALEASIVFGTKPIASQVLQDEWLQYVDRLYLTPLEPPLPSAEHFQYAWMNRAVRELRHVVHCCEASPQEIHLILAASLLRFARFSPAGYKEKLVQEISEERRAYALVIAQRIYNDLVNDGKRALH